MFSSGLYRGMARGSALGARFGARSGASSVTSVHPAKLYSTAPKRRGKQTNFRYLFYTFLFSSACLVFVSLQVDKKPPPKNNFSEKEFQEFEQSTHLKRRHRIVREEDKSKVEFYVMPYVHSELTEEQVSQKLNSNATESERRVVKIIDPQQLIDAEIKDTTRKFLFLLQELAVNGKPYPKGLVTALIKENVKEYLDAKKASEASETSEVKANEVNSGPAAKTAFFITNYPQNTDEAIKFENDISDIKKCVVLHYDMLNELPNKTPDYQSLINNVVGYFDTVGKSVTVTTKWDDMDSKLEGIILEDI